LGACGHHREARDRHSMAPKRLQAVLDLEKPPERKRSTNRCPGHPTTHPEDVAGQPMLGCTEGARGIAQAWDRYLSSHNLQVHGPSPKVASEDGSTIPLAKSLFGAPDRDPTPRLHRPSDRRRREPPAAGPSRLSRLLSQLPDTFVVGKGLPATEEGGGAGPREDRRDPHGGRASSPLLTARRVVLPPFGISS